MLNFMKFKIKYFFVLFFIIGQEFIFAQQLSPPIDNFPPKSYNAASQNWDIDVDDAGVIYVANNDGLLSFDGQSWDFYSLPGGSIIRSVYVFEDKIFTGSYKEFGYWSKDPTGKLDYFSLIPEHLKEHMDSEEFWQIMSFQGDIYFRSFAAVYKYDHNTVVPVSQTGTNRMLVYKNNLILAVRGQGLFSLEENNALAKLQNNYNLKDEKVIDMAVQGDDLIIGTSNALFRYNGDSIIRIEDFKLEQSLKYSELNHIMALDERRLLLGTVKNGLMVYDTVDKSFSVFNKQNGLQNNTVLGFANFKGHIWLSLDSGIDHLELNSSVEFFTDDSGELGTVYDLIFDDKELFLGSNTGVYQFQNDALKILDGSEGHTWNFESISANLFVNHNSGTFSLNKGSLDQKISPTGSFTTSEIPKTSQFLLIGTYTGVKLYDYVNDTIHKVKGINFPVKSIVFESDYIFWALDPYEGLYRVRLNKDLKTLAFLKKIQLPKKGNFINTDVFNIKNQVGIFNGESWYTYNSFQDTLEVFKDMQRFQNYKLVEKNDNSYWFVNTKTNTIKFTDFNDSSIIIPSRFLNNRLVKNNVKIIQSHDSIYYIPLIDGFAKFDLAKFIENTTLTIQSEPVIKRFRDNTKAYDLSQPLEIPFRNSKDISVKVSFPVPESSTLKYRLTGQDTLTASVTNGIINFKNLPHGNYNLDLISLSAKEEVLKSNQYEFTISPPWYLSNLMIIIYALFVVLVLYLLYLFNRFKLKKQQNILEDKFEKEHQERINKLEKERLIHEINQKRKELANTTIVAAKKNEMLMEIQNELNKDETKFANEYRKKFIQKKINKVIKNKDEWKVFETNFNEIHEDFFKVLLNTYPSLTNKDLKLCSYLKMNLASKEIAPLMGISLRGVEIHRYRLRKKMNLDKDINLNNFLIKNF